MHARTIQLGAQPNQGYRANKTAHEKEIQAEQAPAAAERQPVPRWQTDAEQVHAGLLRQARLEAGRRTPEHGGVKGRRRPRA